MTLISLGEKSVMSEPSEFTFSLFGLVEIVQKGELPQPIAYGLLVLLIGMAIRIALPAKSGAFRPFVLAVQKGLSLIRGNSQSRTEDNPKEQQNDATAATIREPATKRK
jgi:hypothetical protein